jgi:hypothetical protein
MTGKKFKIQMQGSIVKVGDKQYTGQTTSKYNKNFERRSSFESAVSFGTNFQAKGLSRENVTKLRRLVV